jgi:hypothetical protein
MAELASRVELNVKPDGIMPSKKKQRLEDKRLTRAW